MARGATKQQKVVPVSIVPSIGLDFSAPVTDIPDNACTRLDNFYYPAGSHTATVRPGVECITSEVNKLGGQITKLHVHNNGTTTYLIAACSDGKLYQMTKAVLESATPAWTEIGAISNNKPSLLTFNTALLCADNHTAIRTWDGSTWSTIAGSPANCTALVEAGNRVVANSGAAGGLDGVYFSAVEDETTWSGGTSLTIRAGYKDGMAINGFGLFGSDLIISKYSTDTGVSKLHRINMEDTTPSNWFPATLVEQLAAQSAHSIASCWNNVFVFFDHGFSSLAGVQQYGDLQIDPVGRKVNKSLAASNALTCEEITYIPKLDSVFILIDGFTKLWTYAPRLTPDGGITHNFCRWLFGSEQIVSVAQLGDEVYFGSSNGRLYKLSGDLGYDELSKGTNTNLTATIRSKKFAANGRKLLVKRSALNVTPLKNGVCHFEALSSNEGATYTLKGNVPLDRGLELIGGSWATTTPIGSTSATNTPIGVQGDPVEIYTRQIARDSGLYLQARFCDGARVEINSISADLAVTGA